MDTKWLNQQQFFMFEEVGIRGQGTSILHIFMFNCPHFPHFKCHYCIFLMLLKKLKTLIVETPFDI